MNKRGLIKYLIKHLVEDRAWKHGIDRIDFLVRSRVFTRVDQRVWNRVMSRVENLLYNRLFEEINE